MADDPYASLEGHTNAFLSGIERDMRDAKAPADYDRERHRDYDRGDHSRRSSHRSSRREDEYDDRRSSHRSSRYREVEPEEDEYERERPKRRRDRDDGGRDNYADRDYDRRRGGRREDDRYGGGRDYDRRSSRRDPHGDPYGDPYRGSGRGGGRGGRYGNAYEEDHRRGGGGGDDWRGGDARDSSPVLKRSPTPEGTIPLSERKRKASHWDERPQGFENMTALQAKATGLFGLPGQSRTLGMPAPTIGMAAGGAGGPPGVVVPQTLPPIHLGAGGPSGAAGMPPRPGNGMMNNQTNRQARRLYIGNITYEASEQNLCGFFNNKMKEMDFVTARSGEPCVSAQVNHEKSYAFVEFRSPEEATNAMSFDGIVFQSQSLKIRRPKDYVGPDVHPPSSVHVPGVVSTNVPDSPNKIFIGGLPSYLNDEQVMELLKSFGELRSFNLVKEGGSGLSKGFAFCEYVDPSLTDIACQGLNGMELGDRQLVVQRASVGAGRQGTAGTGANAGPVGLPGLPPALSNVASSFAGAGGEAGEPTKAMQMLNMVTPQELLDDEEYEEIVEDVRDECAKYGTVVDVRIPRPMAESKGAAAQTWKRTQGGEPVAGEEKPAEREGVGRVYVRFEEVEQCTAALRAIAGRQFGGRLVICAFLREEDWPSDEDGRASGSAAVGTDAARADEDAAEAAVAQAAAAASGANGAEEDDMAVGDD